MGYGIIESKNNNEIGDDKEVDSSDSSISNNSAMDYQ